MARSLAPLLTLRILTCLTFLCVYPPYILPVCLGRSRHEVETENAEAWFNDELFTFPAYVPNQYLRLPYKISSLTPANR